MRTVGVLRMCTVVALTAAATAPVLAQEPEPTTRQAAIEQAQAEKVKTLHPYVPGKAERLMRQGRGHPDRRRRAAGTRSSKRVSGGGFTLGAGYAHHVSPYNFVDVRGSYTIAGYKRAEAEFVAPRLFHRRGALSLLGGWREATQVGFYGLGMDTSKDDRTNYGFQQPYASATPHALADTAAPDAARRRRVDAVVAASPARAASHRSRPCTRRRRCPALAPDATYLHSQGTVGFDWRTSPGYSRRGGFYGVTLHDYTDRDERVRLPAGRLRSDPALSDPARSLGHLAPRLAPDHDRQERSADPVLHAAVARRRLDAARLHAAGASAIANSLLLQAEWRIMANRFLDTAVFYDAGKVTARTSRSRLRRAEERLRLRRPFPRAVRHAAPRRAGQEQRRPDPRLRDVRGLLRLLPCPHHRSRHASRRASRLAARWSPRSACSPAPSRRRRRASTRRSDRARTGVAGRVEGAALRDRAAVRDGRTTCSSPPATSRRARARRTSTRSTRCRTRAGSPTGSARRRSPPTSSRAARSSARRPTRRSGC